MLIDRPDEIIVHPQFEGAHQPLLFPLASEKHDRHEARAVERAKLRAEPERIVAGQLRGNDHAVEIAFRRLEESGLGIVGDCQRAATAKHLRYALGSRCARLHQQHARLAVGSDIAPAQQFLDADIARGCGAQAQFVRQVLQPHQALDACHELQVVDGLGQEIVRTGLEPANAVRHLIERRDHDDRHVLRRRVALQPPADLEAVHVRHHHVEKHDVDLAVLADFKRLGAAMRDQHLEIFGQQTRFQQLHIGRHVVDYKDSRGHQASPR